MHNHKPVPEKRISSFPLSSLAYCPYTPGILLGFPDRAASPAPAVFERRTGSERRRGRRPAKDRRFMVVPVCQRFGSARCPYKRYPLLKNKPHLLLSLCHGKSVLKLIDRTERGSTPR